MVSVSVTFGPLDSRTVTAGVRWQISTELRLHIVRTDGRPESLTQITDEVGE